MTHVSDPDLRKLIERHSSSSEYHHSFGVYVLTSLILVSSRNAVHAKFDQSVERSEDELEKHESNDDGLSTARGVVCGETRVESEGRVESGVVDEDGEHGECEEKVRLSDE